MQGFHLPHRQSSLKEGKTFPIKLYQSEEDPAKGQISDKDVERFLCLVASIINSEKEIN